jgi:regulator of replication initiation timing
MADITKEQRERLIECAKAWEPEEDLDDCLNEGLLARGVLMLVDQVEAAKKQLAISFEEREGLQKKNEKMKAELDRQKEIAQTAEEVISGRGDLEEEYTRLMEERGLYGEGGQDEESDTPDGAMEQQTFESVGNYPDDPRDWDLGRKF